MSPERAAAVVRRRTRPGECGPGPLEVLGVFYRPGARPRSTLASDRPGPGVRDRVRRLRLRRRAGLARRRGHPGDPACLSGQPGRRAGGVALRGRSSAVRGRPGLGHRGRPGRDRGRARAVHRVSAGGVQRGRAAERGRDRGIFGARRAAVRRAADGPGAGRNRPGAAGHRRRIGERGGRRAGPPGRAGRAGAGARGAVCGSDDTQTAGRRGRPAGWSRGPDSPCCSSG